MKPGHNDSLMKQLEWKFSMENPEYKAFKDFKLTLSTRSRNALEHLSFFEDLTILTRAQLMKNKNIGHKTANEIEVALAKKGFFLESDLLKLRPKFWCRRTDLVKEKPTELEYQWVGVRIVE